jgi:hypothetical protein
MKRTTGQCNACKGGMYHDGQNWRHDENDRTMPYCPPTTPFGHIMDTLHRAEKAARVFDQDGLRREAARLIELADELT